MSYGIFILIPIVVVLVLALWLKDTFTSILAGVIVAFAMLNNFNPVDTFNGFLDGIYVTACDDGTMWVLLVVVLFGGLIALIQDAGGVLGFARVWGKLFKTRRSALFGAWLLGIIIWIDDYLNCLAVGAAVRDTTDKHRVSREMLAYVVNSTGVTDCSFWPFSTWGAFMGALMLEAGMVADNISVVGAYVRAMPFIIYGWLALATTLLVIFGIIPLFGPMKKAEKRAIETGEVQSPEAKAEMIALPEDETKFEGKKISMWDFIIPIVVVAVICIVTEDIVIGLLLAIIVCFLLYLPRKLLTFKQGISSLMRGFTDMFPLVILIILGYMFVDANTQLGLIDMVIGFVSSSIPAKLLPMLLFIVLGLLSFAAGSFWGLAIIAFPIVGPLAAAMNIPSALAAGAVISAVCFGGHICIYSDTVILTSASTQTTPAEYFRTSAPLVAIPFVLASLCYLVFGLIFC